LLSSSSALPSSKIAVDYANSRISADNQIEFNIGFAYDDWHKFQQTATDAGYSLTLLLLSGLVHQNEDGRNFDFFRNRLIFPIHNHSGRICAFAGRSLDGSKPKYLNIKGTEVFSKSHTLFGLFFAQQSIRNLNFSIIVEGYTDVIALNSVGVLNSVAPCGTALGADQCKLLARYSKNTVLLYDGDSAGQKAAFKNAQVCIANGLHPSVVTLPKDEDPASFIEHNPELDMQEFLKSRSPFPVWFAENQFTEEVLGNPQFKNDVMLDLCKVLSLYKEESLVTIYIDKFAKDYYLLRSDMRDAIKRFQMESEDFVLPTKHKLPVDVDANEFHKWGFYASNNEYYFDGKEGTVKISNFIMKPLFHVESSVESKRIFELVNFKGFKCTIDFDMNEMTSMLNFKRCIEGKGNFIFWGTDYHLTKLKLKWYEETRTCSEIQNLGWQKEGFWAWSNGISTEEGFQEIDACGLVHFKSRYYFIPAFSNIYLNDRSIFLDERKFMYIKRSVNIRDWSLMLIDVFGINAKFGIAFYIASLFRDHILHLFNNFPILNLFGPKGSGKSQLAMSLSCLFGKQQTPFNIHNGTKPGLSEHIQQFINASAWIDEYKNNIEYDKIETLKSIYDSIGRNRLNYDKGKKKETTQVNSAVTLSGQEMPTADVALFSRVIFLQFHKTEFSAEEKEQYNRLKTYEKQGLSIITAEILKNRSFFVEHYYDHFDIVLKDMFSLLKSHVVEDRILRNWCTILAAIHLLASKLELPFTYQDISQEALKLLLNQNKQIASSNELATFWDMFEAMFDNNEIIDKWHFLVIHDDVINGNAGKIELPFGMPILKIKFNSIYKLYSEHAKRQNVKALPATTLKYYLENSKAFLGGEKATRFNRKDFSPAEGKAIEQKQITSSYCFDYDALGINVIRTDDLFSAPVAQPASMFNESAESTPFE